MRASNWKSLAAASAAILALAVLLSAAATPPTVQSSAAAHEIVLQFDPAQTKVHWTVPSSLHTVHGTFALKNGTVRFDPATGQAAGEIVVLVTSGDSGNDSRDKRMHKEILESAKYPEAIFRPRQIEGQVAPAGGSDVKLLGKISLHGGEHDIIALIHAELAAEHWKGTASFDIPYIDWGLKDPSNFLLKVKPVVNVELDATGTVSQ